MNRWREAECTIEEVLRYDPTLAQAHYHLGRAFEKQGREIQAIAEYQAAISGDKASPDACYSLAMLYRKLHREKDEAAMLTEYKSRKLAATAAAPNGK